MKTICIQLFVLAALAIMFYSMVKYNTSEGFEMKGPIAGGIYLIKNGQMTLAPKAITPVSCSFWQNAPATPSMEDTWVVKPVAAGVYMIEKPGKSECLYTNTDGSVRSYVFGGCSAQNLCGSETLNAEGKLDQYSIRSYWKLAKGPSDTIIMQSMQNNMFVALKNGTLTLQPRVDESCYFTFSKVQ
jgi:hypothetical protein